MVLISREVRQYSTMSSSDGSDRRNALPVLYLRGTHYQIGFDIGRIFEGVIKTMLETYQPLINDYLPVYGTPEGKEVYNSTLEVVSKRFPQYTRELHGIADGARVPFYKLFLIHLDDILPNVAQGISSRNTNGCSTVCINEQGVELLGHTEDGFSGALNNCFIVHAEIPESGEKFCSFCYAGYLPGYAMSFNQHGLIFSLNIVAAKTLAKARTPRTFLCRKLLSASSLAQVEHILRDKGCGAGDAMSLNLTFLNQEGDRLFHNIEVAPSLAPADESMLSVLTISPGENIFHCNKFLRMKVSETGGPIMESSNCRQSVFCSKNKPTSREELHVILGDTSHPKYTIFRDHPDDAVKTLAVGIFDCVAKTWSLYTGNPKTVEPLVILPLEMK